MKFEFKQAFNAALSLSAYTSAKAFCASKKISEQTISTLKRGGGNITTVAMVAQGFGLELSEFVKLGER